MSLLSLAVCFYAVFFFTMPGYKALNDMLEGTQVLERPCSHPLC